MDDETHGAHMLTRTSNACAQAQKKFWGKGPTHVKSYAFDDMLFVVMHGGMTTAEETMLEFGHEDLVRSYRQTFENEMAQRLSDTIGEITGRKVIGQQSQMLFDPHRVIELFIFDETVTEAPRAATAEGQLIDGEVGAATETDALDEESSSGQ